ncbi:MAG TPA: hypothetical protein VHB20_19460 [Verrucomicrobiae bacterium]|nr:hypothetical protein [Verrucomicrobiae bacterium]
MKKIYRAMKACSLYIVFLFFVMMLVTALSSGEKFRFHNGEPLSEGQRRIAIFVCFLLVAVSGYGAFKRAQFDWKLWKIKRRPK